MMTPMRSIRSLGRPIFSGTQVHAEDGATAGARIHRDVAAVGLNCAPNRRQAQSRPMAPGPGTAPERLEYRLPLIGWNA